MKLSLLWLLAIVTTISIHAAENSTSKARRSSKQSYEKQKTGSKKILCAESPNAVYYLKTTNGSSITTEDGTVWTLSQRSAFTALQWNQKDPITVSPCNFWFSPCTYYLTNEKSKKFVEANLSEGPSKEHSLFIADVDTRGYVTLSDGSRWKVGGETKTRFVKEFIHIREIRVNLRLLEWKKGQTVLQGKSNSWFDHKYILINVNESNYLPATPLTKN